MKALQNLLTIYLCFISIICIFINEYLIPEDQAELRKKVQKVKEVRKDGKWEIIRNQKVIVRDRGHKDNNK